RRRPYSRALRLRTRKTHLPHPPRILHRQGRNDTDPKNKARCYRRKVRRCDRRDLRKLRKPTRSIFVFLQKGIKSLVIAVPILEQGFGEFVERCGDLSDVIW